MVCLWIFIAADINKLLHDEDELLDQNIQMPWWDPNYVKDEHEVSYFVPLSIIVQFMGCVLLVISFV